jgi:hypothetical protein
MVEQFTPYPLNLNNISMNLNSQSLYTINIPTSIKNIYELQYEFITTTKLSIRNNLIRLLNLNLNINKYPNLFNKLIVTVIPYSEYNIFVESFIKYYKNECTKLVNLTSEQNNELEQLINILTYIFIEDDEIRTITNEIYENMKKLKYKNEYMNNIFCALVASIVTSNHKLFILNLNSYLYI